ncbi:MAG: right-handed parallel beta-helix repeat-containing protein [Chloroflexota bacterium]
MHLLCQVRISALRAVVRIIAALLLICICIIVTSKPIFADTIVIRRGTTLNDETWTSDNTYVLYGQYSIGSRNKLTIQAGTVVKLDDSIDVRGQLELQGTENNPVVFTSHKDDSYGGDTNGDGDDSAPNIGDWSQIIFWNTDANVRNTVVQYGGRGIFINDGTGVISNNLIRHNSTGVKIQNGAVATVSSNHFSNNRYGIDVGRGEIQVSDNEFIESSSSHLLHDGEAQPEYFGNNFSEQGSGRITVYGTISTDVTWNNVQGLNWPYVLNPSGPSLRIDDDGILRLPAGTIVKPLQGIVVEGVLESQGTEANPVIFTSYKDDAYGGDTNADGADSSPEMADWDGIDFFFNDNPNLSNSIIQYARQGISISRGKGTISNNVIRQNATGIYLVNVDQELRISNNDFFDNQTAMTNASSNSILANAEQNWWGDPTGPEADANPSGSGDKVNGNVDFDPWLTAPNFILECFELSLNVEPVNSGEIHKNIGQNCGENHYYADTSIVLSARPAENYFFKEWTGDVSGNLADTTIEINMDGDKSITAIFDRPDEIEIGPIDSGFRPNPDGYKFDTFRSIYPIRSDFTKNDMLTMFGPGVCAQRLGNACLLKFSAALWHIEVNEEMHAGVCDGMATTSLKFFTSVSDPDSFQAGANSTYELEENNIRRYISYNFALQIVDPVAAAKKASREKTPNEVLRLIYDSMRDGTDPVNLSIRKPGSKSGHTLVPYEIQDMGNWYKVRVYDTNHHDDDSRFVSFFTDEDTDEDNVQWRYFWGGGEIWEGRKDDQAIGIVPLSTYLQSPECRWCGSLSRRAINEGQVSNTQTWITDGASMLITDSVGRKIGYIGDQFVNEIPDAFDILPATGSGSETEPILYIPGQSKLEIKISGRSPDLTTGVRLSHFNNDWAAQVDNLAVNNTSLDTLLLSEDGSEISFHADSSQEITLTLVSDKGENWYFEAQGVNISGNEAISVSHNLTTKRFYVSRSQASSDSYTIVLRKIDENGESKFVHNEISIGNGETHIFELDSWDSDDEITICKDVESDNSRDDCTAIANEVPSSGTIYMPLMSGAD